MARLINPTYFYKELAAGYKESKLTFSDKKFGYYFMEMQHAMQHCSFPYYYVMWNPSMLTTGTPKPFYFSVGNTILELEKDTTEAVFDLPAQRQVILKYWIPDDSFAYLPHVVFIDSIWIKSGDDQILCWNSEMYAEPIRDPALSWSNDLMQSME